MKNFTNQKTISFHSAIALAATALLVVIPWQPVQKQAAAVAPVAPSSAAISTSLNDKNLNFEENDSNGYPTGWGGGGIGYELTSSPNARSGKACGQIQSVVDDDKLTFGSFTSGIKAELDDYRGKRVRYSGYLKSDMKAEAWAGLWMRVDGETNSVAFDNMKKRPVKGKTDWTEYSVVLDVPKTATNINFGFLIGGPGTLWGDDLKLEVVGNAGQGPAVTDMMMDDKQADRKKEVPTNLRFEEGADEGKLTGWFGGGQGFTVELDDENARTGKGCVRMERVDDKGRFAGMSQRVSAAPYLGQKVLLTGYIRTEEAEGAGAGLWMRIDGAGPNVVGFDNMDARPILGTKDWKQYEIEMEVPDNSVYITFGVLLKGGGIAWADDFAIETID